MLVKPFIGAAASGKLGGIVASHNRGGQYYRSFVVPSNNTYSARRAGVRASLGSLATRWSSVLGDIQRAGWAAYAANTPLINRLGDARLIPPMAMYVRCNSVRNQAAGQSFIVDDAPDSLAGDGHMNSGTEVTAISAGSQMATVTFDDGDAWAIADGGHLFLFASAGCQQTLNFWANAVPLAGYIDGDTMTPPTPPQDVAAPPGITWSAGQKVFWRLQGSNSNGQLTNITKGSIIVGA